METIAIAEKTPILYFYKYPELAGAARLAHKQKAVVLPETLVGGMLTTITEAGLRGYADPTEAAAELIKSRLERS